MKDFAFYLSIGIGAIALVIFFWQEKKRKEALMQIAERLGFIYLGSPDDSFLCSLDVFNFFLNHSRFRKVKHVLYGNWHGRHWIVFDYS